MGGQRKGHCPLRLCGTITTGSNTAGVLAKYDAAGNCLWVRSVLVTFDDALAYDIAIDAEDRIYITGSYNGTADFGNGITLDSYVGDDIFLARYDADGTCLWARRAGSSSNDESRGIAVSTEGDVFITGFVGGFTVRFDPLQIASNNQRQVFVASYDSTGTACGRLGQLGTGIGQGARASLWQVANDGFSLLVRSALPSAVSSMGCRSPPHRTPERPSCWPATSMAMRFGRTAMARATTRAWASRRTPWQRLRRRQPVGQPVPAGRYPHYPMSSNDDIVLIGLDQGREPPMGEEHRMPRNAI